MELSSLGGRRSSDLGFRGLEFRIQGLGSRVDLGVSQNSGYLIGGLLGLL